jgi:hypothetical protein
VSDGHRRRRFGEIGFLCRALFSSSPPAFSVRDGGGSLVSLGDGFRPAEARRLVVLLGSTLRVGERLQLVHQARGRSLTFCNSLSGTVEITGLEKR